MLFLALSIGIVPSCSLAATAAAPSSYSNCIASEFSIPEVFGAEILGLNATSLTDFEGIAGNNVCFVTVLLTHPGAGDFVNNSIALPLRDWNGRFQGIGGSGYNAGNIEDMADQTMLGYATATTDAGLDTISADSKHNASAWALTSTGNVNQQLLLNFAHRSVHDMTVIGKSASKSFYGCDVKHAYWNGCSTGGRQGLALAQYYPEDYDGILADAPAIQWNDFTPAQQWPFTVENNEGYMPTTCELNAVTRTVIDACDDLDGVNDGIISAPALCNFTARDLVGRSYSCPSNATQLRFTQGLANVIEKVWQGPRTPENEFLWYGTVKGANLTNLEPNQANMSAAQPFAIPDSWFRGFLAKDLAFDTANVSYAEFADLFLQGHLQYDSTMGAASTDLRPFKRRGGKMITWQGLADTLISPQGTMLYYQKLLALDPSAADFYRLFFSPGIGHCTGGTGVKPSDPIGQLRAWVENGTAPAGLEATSEYPVNAPTNYVRNGSVARAMDLCPYPQVNRYKGTGDPALSSSFVCAKGTGFQDFPGPSGSNYSCFGGPGWYGSAFDAVDNA